MKKRSTNLLSLKILFLASAVAATQQFDPVTQVPPVFTGTDLIVPHPVNGTLYIKLRDDPATVQTITLPVTTILASEEKAAASSTEPAEEPSPSPGPPEPSQAVAPATGSNPPASPAAPQTRPEAASPQK